MSRTFEDFEQLLSDFSISGPVRLRHFDEWPDGALDALANMTGFALAERVAGYETTFIGAASGRVH